VGTKENQTTQSDVRKYMMMMMKQQKRLEINSSMETGHD